VNIIDAVKSGKPFKLGLDDGSFSNRDDRRFSLNREQILSDDWEIEEKKIEITEVQLEKAVINGVRRSDGNPMIDLPLIKKELGF